MFEIVDTESLASENHLLRNIDAAVDLGKIYDMVEPLYCADNGRPIPSKASPLSFRGILESKKALRAMRPAMPFEYGKAYPLTRATATSLTLVPVGPVMMRPPIFSRA